MDIGLQWASLFIQVYKNYSWEQTWILYSSNFHYVWINKKDRMDTEYEGPHTYYRDILVLEVYFTTFGGGICWLMSAVGFALLPSFGFYIESGSSVN